MSTIKVTHLGEDYATVKVNGEEFQTSLGLGEALHKALKKNKAVLSQSEREALHALVSYTLDAEEKAIIEDGCIDNRDSADVPTAELLTVAPTYAYTHARVLSDYLTRTK